MLAGGDAPSDGEEGEATSSSTLPANPHPVPGVPLSQGSGSEPHSTHWKATVCQQGWGGVSRVRQADPERGVLAPLTSWGPQASQPPIGKVGLRKQSAVVKGQAPPLPGCATSGSWLSLSEPHLPTCKWV